MKRISYIAALLLVFGLGGCSVAQAKVDLTDLAEQVAKSNRKIQNEKKAKKVGTWMDRGELMVKVQQAQQMDTRVGMQTKEFLLLVGHPTAQRMDKVQNVEFEVWSMPTTDFYFNGGGLAMYKVTKPIVEAPLQEAFDAYKKAHELDEKGRKDEKIGKTLLNLRDIAINDGVNYYKLRDLDRAITDFLLAAKIDEYELVNKPDSSLYNYIGAAYFEKKDYMKAAEYFKKAIEKGYTEDGNLYCFYYQACANANEAAKGCAYLEEGAERYPEQKNILLTLIQHYISTNQDPIRVLVLVKKALDRDPKNAVLHAVEGNVYDKLNQPEKALLSYKLAIELKPDYVDAYYNIAVLHNNLGNKYNKEAMDLPVSKIEESDALAAKANAEFRKMIEPCEMILQIDPNYKPALEALRDVYFRFRSEPEMKQRHDAIKAKLEAL